MALTSGSMAEAWGHSHRGHYLPRPALCSQGAGLALNRGCHRHHSPFSWYTKLELPSGQGLRQTCLCLAWEDPAASLHLGH